jgi:CRP-like cAMP-binding protein
MVAAAHTALPTGDDLAALPLFRGIDKDILRGVAASSRLVHHDKGTLFLTQGQPVTRFYVVLEGWCGVSKGNAGGQEAILQIFQHGDFLPDPNNAAHIDVSPVNLLALTPLRLIMLSPNIVHNTLLRSPAFNQSMMTAIMHQCQESRDHIEQLTLHSAEERVGRFLLQMRLNTGPGSKDIDLPFDKTLIAAYLGIKPETLSRTLQLFKDQGFVIKRNHVTAPHDQSLCDFCDLTIMKSCQHAHTEQCANHDALHKPM